MTEFENWRSNIEIYGASPEFNKITYQGPSGNTIRGHVLDCNKKHFEAALQAYDPLLYVKWNPNKLQRWGCWEIRRKPEFLTCIDIVEYQGKIIQVTGPYENDLVHHVLDCAFLNYDQLRKLKEMDTFQYGGNGTVEAARKWREERERRHQYQKELAKEHGLRRRKEAMRTFKKEIQAFKEYVKEGKNPHLLGQYWERVKRS